MQTETKLTWKEILLFSLLLLISSCAPRQFINPDFNLQQDIGVNTTIDFFIKKNHKPYRNSGYTIEVERNINDAVAEILKSKNISINNKSLYKLNISGLAYNLPQTPVNVMLHGITNDVYNQLNTTKLEFTIINTATHIIMWKNNNADSDSEYNALNFDDVKTLCSKLLEKL